MTINLYENRSDTFSQNGEDGILEVLLANLGIDTGFFVEFGAWDGVHMSNAHNLYKAGWKGCYIEADESRYRDLCARITDPDIIKVNAIVATTGENALDNILSAHGIAHVDLLSIDIDSDDLRVWESVQKYSPDVVIIEYNPVIPFDTRFVNPKGEMYGNSALSISESAAERNYVLVEGTDTNLIFVRAERLAGSGLQAKSLQAIKDQTFQLRYFVGYDGTFLHTFDKLNSAGIREFFPIPWALSFGIQPVPAIFRKYRDRPNYGAIGCFMIAALIRSPLQLYKLCRFAFVSISGGKGVSGVIQTLRDKNRLTRSLKKKVR